MRLCLSAGWKKNLLGTTIENQECPINSGKKTREVILFLHYPTVGKLLVLCWKVYCLRPEHRVDSSGEPEQEFSLSSERYHSHHLHKLTNNLVMKFHELPVECLADRWLCHATNQSPYSLKMTASHHVETNTDSVKRREGPPTSTPWNQLDFLQIKMFKTHD